MRIVETGSGGDLVLQGNNLLTTEGIFNNPYLALFGGNVEQVTPVTRPENTEMFDWWGNSLLFQNNQAIQFNSITEKTLNETALNSAGLVRIQQAVLSDLSFMTGFAEITVTVEMVTVDRIRITIEMQEPTNKQGVEFVYLWDATKNEMIDANVGDSLNIVDNWLLSNGKWRDEGFWDDNANWID